MNVSPTTDAAMLAQRQTAKSKKYDHGPIFIFPVGAKVPLCHIFYSWKSEFPAFSYSFRYLVCECLLVRPLSLVYSQKLPAHSLWISH